MALRLSFLFLIVSLSNSLSAQVDFKDLKYDKKIESKNAEGKVHQIDYFLKNKLVMQKFYPDGAGIGGFCYGTNLVYDSVLVHLGDFNYVANFSRGGKSYTIYSWYTNSNILQTERFSANGDIVSSETEMRIPNASGPYPLCWYLDFQIGQKKIRVGEDLLLEADYDQGLLYTKKFEDTLTLDSIFYGFKEKALSVLSQSYGSEFISKYVQFNPMRSGFFAMSKSGYTEKSPKHGTGLSLPYYRKDAHQIAFVDLAFDIILDKYRFSCFSLRLDWNGNICHRPVSLWNSKINSTIGLSAEKIDQIISPDEARVIALKNAKWPITDKTSLNLVWEPASQIDSMGNLVYQVNYDFVKRGFDASYARQIQIDAVNGVFIREIEIDLLLESVMLESRFMQNGKFGFKLLGDTLIPAEYDELPEFYSSLMIARKGEKYGLINGQNQVLLEFVYDKIEYHKSSMQRYNHWFLYLKKDGLLGLYETNKGIVVKVAYQSITENNREKLILLTPSGKEQLYNLRTGKLE